MPGPDHLDVGNEGLTWELVSDRPMASSPRADVFARTYKLPDGTLRPDYIVVEERSGVLVMAVTTEGEVLLIRQYRAPVASILWELPAGAMEPGESDAEERARAELREETGHAAERWYALGAIHAAPHRSTETDFGFLALDATRIGGQALDPGESVHFGCFSIAEVEKMIDSSEIRSAPTLAVLYKGMRLLSKLS